VIDFELTEQQKMLTKWVHDFCEKEVRPIALKVDQETTPEKGKTIAEPVITKALQLGMHKLHLPEKMGGLGAGYLEGVMVNEEMAWGDIGFSLNVGLHGAVAGSILRSGNKYLIEKWVEPFVADTTGTFRFCGTMSEPQGGSEMVCTSPDPKLGMKSTAILKGNEYVINASKVFCSNAKGAKACLLSLRTDLDKPSSQSLADFIVPMDAPGVSISEVHNMTSARMSPQYAVFFDNVVVPKEALLARVQDVGYHIYLSSGPMVGIMAVGVARAAYEAVLKYATERTTWGQPIRKHQLIADKLVNMRAQIDSCRALCYRLGWSIVNRDKSDGYWRLMPMGKFYPASMVRVVTQEAVQIMGAYGLCRDTLVEKWSRDALLFSIIDCTNEMQKMFLADRL
jgi:alkylation response protein AidB-like acyl-CoA dehydrogenase